MAEQPESGCYADEDEDRLKENIFHLFNDWQLHLLLKIQKQMMAVGQAHRDNKEKLEELHAAVMESTKEDVKMVETMIDNMRIEIE